MFNDDDIIIDYSQPFEPVWLCPRRDYEHIGNRRLTIFRISPGIPDFHPDMMTCRFDTGDPVLFETPVYQIIFGYSDGTFRAGDYQQRWDADEYRFCDDYVVPNPDHTLEYVVFCDYGMRTEYSAEQACLVDLRFGEVVRDFWTAYKGCKEFAT